MKRTGEEEMGGLSLQYSSSSPRRGKKVDKMSKKKKKA